MLNIYLLYKESLSLSLSLFFSVLENLGKGRKRLRLPRRLLRKLWMSEEGTVVRWLPSRGRSHARCLGFIKGIIKACSPLLQYPLLLIIIEQLTTVDCH